MANEDYGAAISEQGISVNKASDDQKVLDTRWATLDIVAEPVFNETLTLATNGSNDTTQVIVVYAHNLGFQPAFDYEVVSKTFVAPVISDNGVFVADKINIYYVPFVASSTNPVVVDVTVNLRVYNVPITAEYQAPIVQAQPRSGDITVPYGAKFLNSQSTALDINTASIDNYSFNTQLRPLNILQHGTVAVSGGLILIPYNYAQHPLYMLAQYFPNGYSDASGAAIAGPLVGSLSFAGGKGSITSTQITVQGVQATLTGTFAYILFKDPIDLAL